MVCHFQGPDVLVALYNDVVQHMVAMVTHPELRKLSWPVSEFCSKLDGMLSLISL